MLSRCLIAARAVRPAVCLSRTPSSSAAVTSSLRLRNTHTKSVTNVVYSSSRTAIFSHTLHTQTSRALGVSPVRSSSAETVQETGAAGAAATAATAAATATAIAQSGKRIYGKSSDDLLDTAEPIDGCPTTGSRSHRILQYLLNKGPQSRVQLYDDLGAMFRSKRHLSIVLRHLVRTQKLSVKSGAKTKTDKHPHYYYSVRTPLFPPKPKVEGASAPPPPKSQFFWERVEAMRNGRLHSRPVPTATPSQEQSQQQAQAAE
jgi:hypothetical protein